MPSNGLGGLKSWLGCGTRGVHTCEKIAWVFCPVGFSTIISFSPFFSLYSMGGGLWGLKFGVLRSFASLSSCSTKNVFLIRCVESSFLKICGSGLDVVCG